MRLPRKEAAASNLSWASHHSRSRATCAHIEFAHIHVCTNGYAHPAPCGELICVTPCSQRPGCRQTTLHNATQWLICPMKNEQAGIQSAHCAPLNVSTSSCSLSLFLSRHLPFSHNVAFPFTFFKLLLLFFGLLVNQFFLTSPHCILSLQVQTSCLPSQHLPVNS